MRDNDRDKRPRSRDNLIPRPPQEDTNGHHDFAHDEEWIGTALPGIYYLNYTYTYHRGITYYYSIYFNIRIR